MFYIIISFLKHFLNLKIGLLSINFTRIDIAIFMKTEEAGEIINNLVITDEKNKKIKKPYIYKNIR